MPTTAVGDLLAQPELWVAAAAALILGLASVRVGLRGPEFALIVVVGVVEVLPVLGVPVVGAVEAPQGLGAVVVLVLVLMARRAEPDVRPATVVEVLCSLVALAGAYACTPDTERSVVALGAVGALGALALLLRLPWASIAAIVTVVLTWIAVTDGSPRTSAVAATVGIALVHLGAQRHASRGTGSGWARQAIVVAVVVIAVGMLSRGIGLGPGSLRPAGLAAAVVVATFVTLGAMGRSANE